MQAFETDDGTRIAYETAGKADGPAIVLGHALGAHHAMWADQIALLSPDYRVIALDMRGHGQSAVPEGDYSIERLGRDVVALLDHLGIRKAHYVGLSIGGMIGQWLGSFAGDRIDRLVLANTSPYADPAMWSARVEKARAEGMAVMVAPTIERWFTEGFREREPAKVAAIRAQLEGTATEGYAACAAAIRDMDQRETVKRTTVPTLVIAGTYDQATPPEKARMLHDAIAGSRYVELDAAHLSNVEARDAFDVAVTDFLKG